MKIVSGQSGKPRDGVDEYRKMTIGYGSHLNTVVCHNTAPPRSFEAIEGALESFADGFGLKTISLSEEQMRSEADRAFEKAEDLFKNYQARYRSFFEVNIVDEIRIEVNVIVYIYLFHSVFIAFIKYVTAVGCRFMCDDRTVFINNC